MPTVTHLLRTFLFVLCYCLVRLGPAAAQQNTQLANSVVSTPVNTSDADLAADASKNTAAFLSPGVNGQPARERVQFTTPIAAGTTAAGVSLRFDNVALSLLQAGVLPDVSITTYLNGVATGDKWNSNQLLTLSVLQGGKQTDVKLNPAPTKDFNQLELVAGGAVNAYLLNFFAAFGPAPAPLPVKLVSFTATTQGSAAVRLEWATASELNSAYFEVERSTDGISFSSLRQVLAAGTSFVTHTYAYVDASPQPGQLHYYRLRQVDRDGPASYSPVRAVALASPAGQLLVYPTLAHAQATLVGTPPGAEVQLVNAQGQAVLYGKADVTGTAQLVLPAGLAPGIYVVCAGLQATRLVVTK